MNYTKKQAGKSLQCYEIPARIYEKEYVRISFRDQVVLGSLKIGNVVNCSYMSDILAKRKKTIPSIP